MKIPELKIGDLTAKLPIIQGGMGIGVSLSGLAAAVANEGGIGVIASVQNGFREKAFCAANALELNIKALKEEIRRARKLSPKGIIGVNIMMALNNYKELVKACVEEKIDVIISGAGLPKQLPELVAGSNTKIAPIVSSGKGAAVISKVWMKKYNYVPDMIVVEGPLAGGHLGFKVEELEDPSITLEGILVDVLEQIKPLEEQTGKKIPVIAAGGIYTGKDINRMLRLGASGVQIATRFIATDECDASLAFKQALVDCKEEDIQIIKSPVGMPGRAIHNKLIERLEKEGRIPPEKCDNCLTPCNPATTEYCISGALAKGYYGDTENGLLFTGQNGYRVDKIVPVHDLIEELKEEMLADEN